MSYIGRKGQTAPLASADLPTNSISTAHLINDAVTSAKIGVDVIVAEDIAANAITVAEIADDAVTGAKLANDIAISTTGAITTTGAFTSVGIDDNASGATAITIDSSENVGIGLTDPGSHRVKVKSSLDWDGSVANSAPLTTTSTNSYGKGAIAIGGNDNCGIFNCGSGQGLGIQSREDMIFYCSDTNDDKLGTKTERMRIDSSGNVGIGTTSPDAKIEIAQDTPSALSGVSNRNTLLHLTNSDDNYATGTASAIDFGTNLINATASIISTNNNSGAGGWGGNLIFATSVATGDSLAERMRIDSSGNVGIGKASQVDSSKVQIEGAKAFSADIPQQQLNISDSTAMGVGVGGAISFSGKYTSGSDSQTTFGSIEGVKYNGTSGDYTGSLIFKTRANGGSNTEKMRIHHNKVGIGTASPSHLIHAEGNFTGTSTGAAHFTNTHGSVVAGDEVMRISFSGDGDATGGHFVNFYDAYGDIGRINVASTSATQYSTSSDYRLKDVVSEIVEPLSKVNQLNPIVFKWKQGGDSQEGFLAHEVQEVVPIAVSGEKDAMHPEILYAEEDELPEGVSVGDVKVEAKINRQHMDMTYLIPILVGSIQELSAKVNTLENA